MQQPRFGKKTYAALGKMLLSRHPEVAESLLPYCQVSGDTNLNNLPVYFARFCEILEINPTDYTGKLFTQDKWKIRRLFIGAMLHIYNEHIFHQPHTTPIFRNGFAKKLSEVQAIDKSRTSQLIRQVMFEEKTYEDFRESIQQIVSQLKLDTHGNT